MTDALETPGKLTREDGSRASSSNGDATIDVNHGEKHGEPSLSKADSKVINAIRTKDAGNTDADPFQGLAPHEVEILKKQLVVPEAKGSIAKLYRYASTTDICIMIVSAICAIAGGAALPLMTVVFGNLQGTFQDYFQGLSTYEDFMNQLTHLVLYFVYLGIAEFVTVYVSTVGFIYVGERIAGEIRAHYLESSLRQNIGYYDHLGSGEVVTRITADCNAISDGISEKVGTTIAALATFVSAFVIGFVTYWKLTLILISTVFAFAFLMGGSSRFIVKYTIASTQAYAVGGTVAEEVISSIRNAVAFGNQNRLAKLYDGHLARAEAFGFRQRASVAIMLAGMMLIVFLNWGLAFWQGSHFVLSGERPLSNILTVTMAMMVGAFNIGNIAPNIQAFNISIGAAAKVFSTIDRESPLDPAANTGKTLDHVDGFIRLENVKHIYPSRPDVVVMDGVSLDIPAGKTTALVGASGSGKSTIVGLVERFYTPVTGTLYLDGHDIAALNLRWLRQNISLVSQEPTLFSTTIYNNIRHGLVGTKMQNERSEKQTEWIHEAAKKANAHDFIVSLPEGYQTQVGDRGFLLSGGQKQRIAIARAIVSDPRVLLLDEATASLDSASEMVVQKALETASENRTTIVIAHRLSTIRNAENIVVMGKGVILEQGTHKQLIEKRGAYHQLVTTQNLASENKTPTEEMEEIEARDEELIRKASTKTGTKGDLNRSATQTSASSKAIRGGSQKTGEDYDLWTLIKFIAAFNRPEWFNHMTWGLFWSVICGGGNPVAGVFFAYQILTISSTTLQPAEAQRQSNFWSSMYLMLGVVQFLSFSFQGIAFAKCSERLVHRVRDQAFRAMLRQDVAFFDEDFNTAGSLTSFLATEATHVAGLSGVTLGTIMNCVTTLVAAIVVGLIVGWKLSLVCAATIPVLLGCGFLRFHMLSAFQLRSKKAYEKSAAFASEAISAIRTVASLTRETDVLDRYKQEIGEQQRASLKSILWSASLYAASQSLLFLIFALGFWYGGSLIARHEYDMFQFFLCFMCVIYSAQSAGAVFSFAPDMSKSRHAASQLKTLFDRPIKADTWSSGGESIDSMRGHVEFRDVHFRYPTRPEQPVLRGLDLTIRPGQYVALVGASGCGKSTTISLLERFYDPLVGGVYVDGKEISTLNINQYRSFIALVGQESTLYQGTVRENILLGSPHDVSEEDLRTACQQANIWDFLMSLPDGLNTAVGNKGTLLSGGQKQRIAIARALIRNPTILLLDEATSALDEESQHIVNQAIDNAARGRTTIAVAHRLSTIKHADVIYVFDKGRIVEKGTHADLIRENGRYAELVNLQSLQSQ